MTLFARHRGACRPLRAVPVLVMLCALAAFGAAQAAPSMIYLVRHGEKGADGKDPALTAEGRLRAQNIAAMLAKTGVAHVFSSDTQRTRQTAQPLAQASGLPVQLYDARAPQALVAQVKALDGAVLVVGHSNTLPELVRLFGGQPGADIGDDEYDRLYQLIAGAGAAVTTVRWTSLPAGASSAR